MEFVDKVIAVEIALALGVFVVLFSEEGTCVFAPKPKMLLLLFSEEGTCVFAPTPKMLILMFRFIFEARSGVHAKSSLEYQSLYTKLEYGLGSIETGVNL